MAGISLGTLVTYNPWSVCPTALLEDVAQQFDELRFHHVAVVDSSRRVIGMLSETDLLGASKTRRAALVGGGLSDTDDAPLVFARDVMSRDVVAIEPTADLAAALGLLLKRQIHALPVVEGDRLVGMVSSRDFVREFSYGELPGTCDLVASQLSDAPPEIIAHSATLDDALDVIDQNGVSCLAVMQGDCPIGVTSQRDIKIGRAHV